MTAIQDSFQTALAAFKKPLTPQEQDRFQVTTLKDVREVIARI